MDSLIDYKILYERLKSKGAAMREAQKEYLKTKSIIDLKKLKALENVFDEMITPKQKKVSQATIEWLGQ